MKRILPLLSAILLIAATVAPVSAQFSVSPSSAAFKAEVGASDEVTFQVTNTFPVPASIQGVEIQGTDATLFSLAWVAEPTGGIVNQYDVYQLNVTFDPTVAGDFTATLRITYIQASPVPIPLDVTLSATATAPAPPPAVTPSEQIHALIAFYEQALGDGSIYGVGRGRSAPHKALVIQHLLYSAQWLTDAGYLRWARLVLESVARHTDGAWRPKDFVDGPGLAEFNTRLLDLIAALGG